MSRSGVFSRSITTVSSMVLALSLLAAGTAFQAAADPPSSVSFPFSDSQTDVGLCGFPIQLTFTGTFGERDFYDGSGQLIRVQIHSSDVATAVVSSGATATGHEVVNIVVDLRAQTEKKTGIPLHFNGLLIEAGQISIDANGDVTVSGHHQLLAGDVAKFCASFG